MSIGTVHFKETIGFCSAAKRVGILEAFVQMLLRDRKVERISIRVGLQHHCD